MVFVLALLVLLCFQLKNLTCSWLVYSEFIPKPYRDTRWDLKVNGSLANSESVLILPLAHPVDLLEKCTHCITDQLTLSAMPHMIDTALLERWRLLLVLTRQASPLILLFSTSPRLERAFSLSCWYQLQQIFASPDGWALLRFSASGGLKNRGTCCKTKSKHKPWSTYWFWFADDRILTPRRRGGTAPRLWSSKTLRPQSESSRKLGYQTVDSLGDNLHFILNIKELSCGREKKKKSHFHCAFARERWSRMSAHGDDNDC